MKAKRRKFTAAFKAQVALSAIQERKTLAELSKRFSLIGICVRQFARTIENRNKFIYQQF